MNCRPGFNFPPILLFAGLIIATAACRDARSPSIPVLAWYVFNEPSGAFREAAADCNRQARGRYRVVMTALPTDADQQREQLVRRLAAKDPDIDIIGLDVIWTAEFAEAGWILPWREATAQRIALGRIPVTVDSATYRGRLWAAPFTSNAQLLWYRRDRIAQPPATWDALIRQAEGFDTGGAFQIQGQRYEGLAVFFISLLASAGGSVLAEGDTTFSLANAPTETTLALMKRLALSPAADKALDTAREDQTRLAFETGNPTFMANYSFVWPSAQQNSPEVAAEMAFGRWPSVYPNVPSRVTVGGLNLGIGAFSRHPQLAFAAAECLSSKANQIRAAEKGGLPPTLASLYDAPEVRRRFPFADALRNTLQNAVLRPKTPVYNDISLAISRTLHPLRRIDPAKDTAKLRHAVAGALRSEGLL